MTNNFLTRGLQRLFSSWPREQHALRNRRERSRRSIPALIEVLEPRKLLVAASLNAFQAGNTLIITAPQPNYDVSSLRFAFYTGGSNTTGQALGLFLTPALGTKVNGSSTLLSFPGVTAVTGFLGTGDDIVSLSASLSPHATIGSVNLFLSGGLNSVTLTELTVGGPMLITGEKNGLTATNTVFSQGLTMIASGGGSSVGLNGVTVNGAATFLLGSNADLSASNSRLGATLVIGNGVDVTANSSTIASLTVIGGTQSDKVRLSTSTVNGGLTLLLGGGANTVMVESSSVTGFAFLESGAGSLTFTASTSSFDNGMLVIGGATQSDTISLSSCVVGGSESFFLGGGPADQFTADNCTVVACTLFASGNVNVRLQTHLPNIFPLDETFNGPALFVVGPNSTLLFGRDPNSDKTTFQSNLLIIGGTGSTLRRRNVTINGVKTLIGVTDIS